MVVILFLLCQSTERVIELLNAPAVCGGISGLTLITLVVDS